MSTGAPTIAELDAAIDTLRRVRDVLSGTLELRPAAETVFTLQQASARAGVHEDTLKSWTRKYGLGARVGGRYRYPERELVAFVEGRAGS